MLAAGTTDDVSAPCWQALYKDCMEHYRRQRNAACTDIIIHPLYPNGARHFWDQHHQKAREIFVSGFAQPFLIFQDFSGSKEDLGSVLWNASIVLAGYISKNRKKIVDELISNRQAVENEEKGEGSVQPIISIEDLQCVELGCGIGPLASLVAAHCGLASTATDLTNVVQMAESNVQINCTRHSIPSSKMSIQTLEWGLADQELCRRGFFDLILAADVLYATAQVNDLDVKLLQTLEMIMGPHTIMLIAYTVRSGREPLFFTETLTRAGFRYREVGHGADPDAQVACSIYRGLRGVSPGGWLGAGATVEASAGGAGASDVYVDGSKDASGRTHIMEVRRMQVGQVNRQGQCECRALL